jgi:hypothetical protein
MPCTAMAHSPKSVNVDTMEFAQLEEGIVVMKRAKIIDKDTSVAIVFI